MSAELPIFEFSPGTTPLLISIPHTGTGVPDSLVDKLTASARGLPDTDWLVDELYGFARELGVGTLRANFNRYVVDLNRPPDDTSLYDRNTTGLFPRIDFSGENIYREGSGPDESDCAERLNRYWKPYHYKLQGALNQLQQQHGHAVLLDAHSIAAQLPMLFAGTLPDFNLGSNDGCSADRRLVKMAYACLDDHPAYSSVLDGRFKGGYITRHYGSPVDHVHALQLELSQAVYLAPAMNNTVDQDKYRQLQPVLRQLIETLLQWKRHA